MKVRVRTTPQAEAQAEVAAAWWRRNRPAAATLFADELSGALDLLADAPDIGRRYRRVGIPGLNETAPLRSAVGAPRRGWGAWGRPTVAA
jgi:plasmid stabilization system protein ParE